MMRVIQIVFVTLFAVSATSGQCVVEEGWTDFVPEPNQKIVYVSDSLGSDPGAVYTWNSSHQQTFGSCPFEPDQSQTTIAPYKTIEAAYAELVDGAAGWILLRRGDSWEDEGWDSSNQQLPNLISGPSSGDGWHLIGAYSDSQSEDKRPIVQIIRATQGEDPLHSIAIVGVTVLGSQDSAIYLIAPDSDRLKIEDVLIPPGDGFGIHVTENADVVIRRCVIFGRHDPAEQNLSHRSGMFIDDVTGLWVEENILWHNGWATPSNCPWPGNWICPTTGGVATVFNQNAYISCDNTSATFVRNISADASNVGCHHRVPGLNENNLYLRNNIGVHVGPAGSSDESPCLPPISGLTARWNVILDSAGVQGGDSGIKAQRLHGQNLDNFIRHNLIAHFTPPGGSQGMLIDGQVAATYVTDNVVYVNKTPLVISCNKGEFEDDDCTENCGEPLGPCPDCQGCGSTHPNICCETRPEEFIPREVFFERNHLQNTGGGAVVLHRIWEANGSQFTTDWGAHWFTDNIYWTSETEDQFRRGTNAAGCCFFPDWGQHNVGWMPFEDETIFDWQDDYMGMQDSGSTMTDMSNSYPDPCRNIQRYLEENFGLCWEEDPICGTTDPNCTNPEPHDPITTFMLLAIDQRNGNWDERLTAARVTATCAAASA